MTRRPVSLRRYLLLGILLPVVVLFLLNEASLYSGALAAANTAYDRTLLASAKDIGEQLDVDDYDAAARHRALLRAGGFRGRQPQPDLLPRVRPGRRHGVRLRGASVLVRPTAAE